MPDRRTVLIVDDSLLNRKMLSKILCQYYDIIEAVDGQDALDILHTLNKPVSCIMLDLVMPVMDGFGFLQHIREEGAFNDMPVIVVTGNDDKENEKKALRYGAWDFVSKPFDPDIVLFRMKNAIDRSMLTAFEQIKYIAEFDTLTGIYNKNKFFQETHELLQRCPEQRFVICRMDIDRFQLVNSYFGVSEGDKLLKYIAETLCNYSSMRKPCTYGRLDGDAFGMCFPYCGDDDVVAITDFLQSHIRGYNIAFNLVAAFGIYVVEDGSLSVATMIDRANLAARTIKGNYIKNHAFYTASMGLAIEKEQEIINEMNTALEQGQFHIVIQPKYSLKTDSPVGGEVLVRWQHPVKGTIAPVDFIPVFERNGFIAQVDNFVWDRTCALLREWLDKGITPFPLSVNVSRVDMYNPRVVEIFCELIEKYGIDPAMLQLEVTESAYMDNPHLMREIVGTLRKRGFTILMDDFGSGYSSLNTLKDIEVDYLKIDTNFLASTTIAGRGENILASMVRMAKWLGIPVIAEGAERVDQVEFLRSIGCEYVQGFYFARPLQPEKYLELARSSAHDQEPVHTHFDGNAIWASNPQMEMLFSNSLQAMALYEYQSNQNTFECLRVNKTFLSLFGYDAAATSLRDPLENVLMEYRSVMLDAVRAACDARSQSECRYMYRATDGRLAWVELKLKYVDCADNKNILLGTLSDISEQQTIENELYRYRNAITEMRSSMNQMLVVDDQKINRNIMRKIFSPHFTVFEAANGQEALDVLAENDNKMDIILLDMIMPVMNGSEFLKAKNANGAIESIPVVIVTADDTPSQQINMLSLGANDYIVKPIIPEVAMRRISNVLESSNRFRNMLREYHKAIDMAKADPLTHVYNRSAAEELIGNILTGKSPQHHALIMLDIDDYKGINDTYGHTNGDVVLTELSHKLMYFFRAGDIVARMGGDEFCVLMLNVRSADIALNKCRDLCNMIAGSTIGEAQIKITCSVGVALSKPSMSFLDLYRNADSALYESKRTGKNCATLYSDS